jgi:hypothetical protein
MSKNTTPEGQNPNITSLLKEAEAITSEAAKAKKTDTVPAQATEEPTVEGKGDDNVVELSKFQGLKTKAIKLAKNKKVLIGTAAVVALGVIIKVATGQDTVVEEPQQSQDENPDNNEPVVLDEV